ncbi:hypothetical protein AURDEDRAFT_58129 [Auricularia subglabra TFB-10046 SS5]|nr:hypothetical protein AURDEDRAFT_58129 [Auricularia subglabra TFB-10046 SS5]
MGSANLDLSLVGSWTGGQEPQGISTTSPKLSPQRRSLDADALTTLGVRIGTRVLHNAQALASQAKHRVIGDGTSAGFVRAVLDHVEDAAPPTETGFGHLIFSQTANSVQLRKCDILAGDVVQLRDARLHGRKGLKSYTQTVDDAVGVVVEFEHKGSKIRALKANQAANAYPAVEQVSYRLDDLKSGTVKVCPQSLLTFKH